MKKRIRLKKKKNIKWTLIILVLLITFIISLASKQIRKSAQIYIEAKTKEIVSKEITLTIKDYLPKENIFKIEKDGNEIIGASLDNEIMNQKLVLINEKIEQKLDSMNNTIIFKMPLLASTNNIFFANKGPKIPIKDRSNGNIINNIRTEVKNYGLNNALITAYLDLNIECSIILPITIKKVEVNQTIVLGTRIIQGKIPNYYVNNNTI